MAICDRYVGREASSPKERFHSPILEQLEPRLLLSTAPVIEGITDIHDDFRFIAGTGIPAVYNTYQAEVSGTASSVTFGVGGMTSTDTNGADGWSATFNMSAASSAASLSVTASGPGGSDVETYDPNLLLLPAWFHSSDVSFTAGHNWTKGYSFDVAVTHLDLGFSTPADWVFNIPGTSTPLFDLADKHTGFLVESTFDVASSPSGQVLASDYELIVSAEVLDYTVFEKSISFHSSGTASYSANFGPAHVDGSVSYGADIDPHFSDDLIFDGVSGYAWVDPTLTISVPLGQARIPLLAIPGVADLVFSADASITLETAPGHSHMLSIRPAAMASGGLGVNSFDMNPHLTATITGAAEASLGWGVGTVGADITGTLHQSLLSHYDNGSGWSNTAPGSLAISATAYYETLWGVGPDGAVDLFTYIVADWDFLSPPGQGVDATTDVESEASDIDVSVSPSSTSVGNGDTISVSGSARYNTGVPVPTGTAIITFAGQIWTAPVHNGYYTRSITIPANASSQALAVSVTDTQGRVGQASRDLSVQGSQPTFGEMWSAVVNDYSTYWRDEGGGGDWDIGSYNWPGLFSFSPGQTTGSLWGIIHLEDMSSNGTVRMKLRQPDGNVFESREWDNPYSGSDSWWWVAYGWDPVPQLHEEGLWTFDWYYKSVGAGSYTKIASDSFTYRYELREHLTARNVQSSSPSMWSDQTNTFYQDNSTAFVWGEAANVSTPLEIKWEFYDPNGQMYGEPLTHTTNSPSSNYAFDWTRFYSSLPIANSDAAQKCGTWQVDVSIKDAWGAYENVYTDYFRILERPGQPPEITLSLAEALVEGNNVSVYIGVTDNTYIEAAALYWDLGDGVEHHTSWADVIAGSFFDTVELGTASGASLEYWATATDTSGNTYVTPHSVINPQPAAPLYVHATALAPTTVALSWSDNSDCEDGFIIERHAGDGNWVQIATVEPNVFSYEETNLTPRTSSETYYYYRVGAYNSAGTSATHVSVTTPPAPGIGGMVWNDLDGEGDLDPGEAALVDWKIFIDTDQDGQWDEGEDFRLTDLSGEFSFVGLPAGTHVIDQVPPSGWRQTTADGGPYIIVLETDEVENTVFFGNHRPTAVAGGPYIGFEGTDLILDASSSLDGANDIVAYEWDLDNDGEYDDATGSLVTLSKGNEGSLTVAVKVTDQGGAWDIDTASITIENVAPKVLIAGAPVISSPGTTIELTGVVTDPGVGDTFMYAWSVTRNAMPFAFSSDEILSFLAVDVGDYIVVLTVTDDQGGIGTDSKQIYIGAPSVISGTRWNDLNCDGVLDGDEPRLAHSRIFIDENRNAVWDSGEPSTFTDANGDYSFNNLPPGTYVVVDEPEIGWSQTSPTTSYAPSSSEIDMEWITIGHQGNSPKGHGEDWSGAVPYAYQIGKYEVTNTQYTAFLNAKATLVDPNGLYNADTWGIVRSGSGTVSDPWTYSDKPGHGSKPVNYVSWNDALCFSNWMHNGQGDGDILTGAYDLTSFWDGYRQPDARVWLPTLDEWAKAAYYRPSGDAYWRYAMQTDGMPAPLAYMYDNGYCANYTYSGYGYNMNAARTGWPITNVGAYRFSDSAYGTYDQNGNVSEWINAEQEVWPNFWGHSVIGGDWDSNESFLPASGRRAAFADFEADTIGFRVARAIDLKPHSIHTIDVGPGESTDNVNFGIHRPTVDAGGPYTGGEGEDILLSVASSYDGDPSHSMLYLWDLDNDGVYDDARGMSATFRVTRAGTYAVLKVVDDDGAWSTASIRVTVTSNIAPSADAGGPYTCDEGQSVLLDAGSSSDPGNNIIFYEWDLDGDGWFDDATGMTVNWVPEAFGAATIGLRVTDDFGAVDTDTATITCNNVAPTVDISGVPLASLTDSTINLTSLVTDPGASDVFTYTWNVTVDGNAFVSGSDANLTFTAADVGYYAVTLTVADVNGGTAETTRTFTVYAPAEISGTSWDDLDANGVRDAGEPGISNRTVYIDQNNNGQLDFGELSTSTDSNGDYSFTELLPGVYPIAEILPVGWTSTEPQSVTDWVVAGDPGNIGDRRQFWSPVLSTVRRPCQFGSIDYSYKISRHEVTNSEYSEFLNSVAWSHDIYLLSLYNPDMGDDLDGGILRHGDNLFHYSVKANMGNKPVNFVSWYDALRYVNWLHNGKPVGYAGFPNTTEDGAYDMSRWAIYKGIRKPEATVFLPSENEWHKAAYYDRNFGGPEVGGYWPFGVRSHSIVPATADDSGNINNGSTFVANHGATVSWGDGTHVTSVGSAGLPSESYYGAADMTGNVSEWTQDTAMFYNRDTWELLPAAVVRGGAFDDSSWYSSSSWAFETQLDAERASTGFRIAGAITPYRLALSSGDVSSDISFGSHRPIADAGGPYTSDEGTDITLDASGSIDGADDIVSYEWDLDEDGQFDDATSATVILQGVDAATFTVAVKVMDSAGAWDIDTATVSFGEVAPTVSINGVPATVLEGTLISITSTVIEPSPADQAAGFTYRWSVTREHGRGITLDYAIGTEVNFSFTPNDDGVYIVTLLVEGKDGPADDIARESIIVGNVNEQPTDISLSNSMVAENEPVGTVVGTLSTTDPDAGDTAFTYSLASGAGGADNTSFMIDGSIVKTAAIFDYEARDSYSIRVRSTDAGELYTEKAFAIHVDDVGELRITSWGSAADHGALGELVLAIPDDGTFSDPRNGGIQTLVLEFSEAINPANFTSESVQIAGIDADGADVNLSGIGISTSMRNGDTVGVIEFSDTLPDAARYIVRVEGVTDAAGNPLTDDNDRIMTALIGDAWGDLRVNNTDLGAVRFMRDNGSDPLDPTDANAVRTDVWTDGSINNTDFGGVRFMRDSGHDARFIPDPVLPVSLEAASVFFAAEGSGSVDYETPALSPTPELVVQPSTSNAPSSVVKEGSVSIVPILSYDWGAQTAGIGLVAAPVFQSRTTPVERLLDRPDQIEGTQTSLDTELDAGLVDVLAESAAVISILL